MNTPENKEKGAPPVGFQISLRDYLAGCALQGMAAGDQWGDNFGENSAVVAKVAYAAADAMIAERSKP